jgi:hypothetical protein
LGTTWPDGEKERGCIFKASYRLISISIPPCTTFVVASLFFASLFVSSTAESSSKIAGYDIATTQQTCRY